MDKLHLMTWTADGDPPGGGFADELLSACMKGDRSAQKHLFDSLSPKMLSLCLRYVGDRDTAEDILQEGFITVFSRLDSYSGKGSFEGWARKIFVNTALMHLRRTDALKLSVDIGEAGALSSADPGPVQQMGYNELMSLITMLPEGYRTVFNLYVVDGYSHKDISDMLGITEATSRSKLQRARMKLQEMIKDRL